MEISKPEEIENALFEYHLELASIILTKLQKKSLKRIVEIGAGSGNLTIPLMRGLENDFEKYYCVDSFFGPYEQDRKTLESKLKPNEKIEILNIDAKEMDKTLSNIDLVIGHEVLCDLNSKQLEKVMSACFNILREGGMFIHSELSPFTSSKAEELVQIANKFSKEPISDSKWFSPGADELAGLAKSNGFRRVNVEYRKIPLKFKKEAALDMVKTWKTKREFLDNYGGDVYNIGIEYPMEQILFCLK